MSILKNSDSIIKVTAALRKAKLEFGPLLKNQENAFFKNAKGKASRYADLGAVLDATAGPLEKEGLMLLQFPVSEENRVGVRSLLFHESGEYLMDEFYLSLGKQDAQAGAGAVTYARRVAMKAIFGITDEDDDGNTASRKEEKQDNTAVDVVKKSAAAASPATKAAAQKQGKTTGEGTGVNNAAKGQAVAAAKTSVPKSEIPAELAGESTGGALPSETEMKAFRKQFVQFVDKVEEAGVTQEKGNPVQKKALKYLLTTTGAKRPEDITQSAWRTFFTVTNSALGTKESAAELVSQIK